MCTASDSACIWRASSRSAAASTAGAYSGAVLRIARVDVFGYDLRYAHGEYVMSGGRSVTSLPSTVVRLEADTGVVGLGRDVSARLDLPGVVRGRGAGGAARTGAGADRRRAVERAGTPWTARCAATRTRRRRSTSRAGTCSAGRSACRCRRCSAACVPRTSRSTSRSRSGWSGDMVVRVRDERANGITRFQLKLGSDPHEDAERVRAVVAETRGGRARDRRRQRRLAAGRRGRRGAGAGGPRPRAVRAAVPDARGVPDRARAHDAADGARRGDHRRARADPRVRRDGGRESQARPGRRADRARG